MPLRDGGKNSHSTRKIQRLKQCAALVFVAAGLLTVVDFSGLQLTSEAAQKRSVTRVQQSSASDSDCFLLTRAVFAGSPPGKVYTQMRSVSNRLKDRF